MAIEVEDEGRWAFALVRSLEDASCASRASALVVLGTIRDIHDQLSSSRTRCMVLTWTSDVYCFRPTVLFASPACENDEAPACSGASGSSGTVPLSPCEASYSPILGPSA